MILRMLFHSLMGNANNISSISQLAWYQKQQNEADSIAKTWITTSMSKYISRDANVYSVLLYNHTCLLCWL